MYYQQPYSDSTQQVLENHQRRIKYLEREVSGLKNLVEQLQARPPINVERIEYRFDQLKVDTLEGTLHVGLTAQDLQNSIEDFHPGIHATPPPQVDPKNIVIKDQIEQGLRQFMENSIPEMITDTQTQLGLNHDPSYADFIKQDVEKQLRTRIDIHLKQLSPNVYQEEPPEKIVEMITARLKGEIQQGVFTFFSRFSQEPAKGDGLND